MLLVLSIRHDSVLLKQSLVKTTFQTWKLFLGMLVASLIFGLAVLHPPPAGEQLGPSTGTGDDDLAHLRFATELTTARDQFVLATANFDLPLAAAASLGTAGHESLDGLTGVIATLRHVRTNVVTEDRLSADVRAQVAWDLDRMVSDAERLLHSSLSPLARTALAKALALRFSVLLAPAFWSAPIRRDLLSHAAATATAAERDGALAGVR